MYSVVQPDICIICNEAKLDDRGCLGAPDGVIEILSPGNSSKEQCADALTKKKLLHEENGVREYWILDPEYENAFQFYLIEAEVYSPVSIYVNDETLACVIFPDLAVSLEEVFAAR